MANTPLIKGPDGVLRTNLVLGTMNTTRIITGTVPATTVDVQVSVRGAAFTSDPDLVSFSSGTFIVPNLAAEPDGLQLLAGDNLIRVRAVLANGDVTAPADALFSLSLDGDVGDVLPAPTAIRAERRDRTVAITIESVPGAAGYHFYASAQAGGGTSGYSRLNPEMVISGAVVEDLRSLGELAVDTAIATASDGRPAADPLFVNISGDQRDASGTILRRDFTEPLEVPEGASRVRTVVTVSEVRQITRFTFTHDRQASLLSAPPTIPNSEFASVPSGDPLYYAVSAVYLEDGREIETELSPEVAASPLVVTPAVGAFPTVGRQQIVRDIADAIYRVQPEVSIQPGSVIRDTFIDPFASEAERLRFMIDFLHQAQSFATLLALDDPSLSGLSVPVRQSGYKQAIKAAFFLSSDADVQALIDSAFDKLASNRGVVRERGRRSRGEALFYVTTRPTADITIPIGTRVLAGGRAYRTTSVSIISPAGAGAGYNPATGRFSARAFIQAEEPGEGGDLAPGQIQSAPNAPAGVRVTNAARTFGGTNAQSNLLLAQAADRKLASVDTGTLQGMVSVAIDVPGVRQVSVMDAGHPLMTRDIDPATGRHVGGKVDVWLRGLSPARVTDAFAFPFALLRHAQFEPVGDPADLAFRLVDPPGDPSNPIIELLDRASWGFSFRNETTGSAYDLTGASITSFDTVQLASGAANQVPAAATDIFMGAVRRRAGDRLDLSRQPVRRVLSVAGEKSGTLPDTSYDLFRGTAPLDLGRSFLAGDHVLFSSTATGVPSSVPIVVTDEAHVMLGGVEHLASLGTNPLSVVVTDQSGTVTFIGPYDPSVALGETADYTLVDGGPRVTLGILPTSAGRIVEGQTVLVSYEHDENFTVEYEYDSLVGVVQSALDNARHATADVLAKQAVPVLVDVHATVVLRPGSQGRERAHPAILTALSRLFDVLALGDPIRQSDVLAAIESVPDVSYVVVPLTRLAKATGSLVIREPIAASFEGDATEVLAWKSSTARTWLLRAGLTSATTDAGGSPTEWRGVSSDGVRLDHLESAPDADGDPMRATPAMAFIIGDGGLSIPGLSDDATILAELGGDPTAYAIAVRRLELTANRVLVSLTPSDAPWLHDWDATYVTAEDDRLSNVDAGPVEFLVLGDVSISYDVDREVQRRLR